jgi:serine phosphatase RsbU (regulator of sigma subunit)
MEDDPVKDERKTKKQLIEELEDLRGELSEVRQQLPAGDDASVVARQLAAERVRAEAMAMQTSDDLLKVAGMFFQGMKELGVEAPIFNISFIDEKADRVINYSGSIHLKEYGISWTSPELIEFSRDIAVSVRERVLSEWWVSEGQKHWHNRKVHTFRINPTKESAEAFLENIGGTTPTSFEPFIGEFIITNVPFKYGVIGFRVREHNDEYVTIVQELAEALSLGYLRFLDFQQLEEQAESLEEQNRYLMEEQSLEHVRAEVAAMRRSEDLGKVVKGVEDALAGLNVPCDGVSILIFDEERDMVFDYGRRGQGPEISFQDAQEHEHFRRLVQYWRESKTWHRYYESDHPMISFRNRWIVDVPFPYGTVAMNRTGTEPFPDDEISLLERCTEIITLGYSRFLDFQRVDEAQKKLIDELEEELQTAHDLQMDLMPTAPPSIEGLDIAGRCLPANHVGGDLFQYFQQDGKLAISLADVTGHAMEAAIPVVMFNGILDTQMEAGDALQDLFTKLNRSLHRNLDSRTFVCFAMGELDTASYAFKLSNGGCPYPFHYRANSSEITELQVDAYPLGVRPDTSYQTTEVQLQSGDFIIFCSDGIIEAGNGEGDIYGFEQTAETIRQGCSEDLSAEALIDRVISEVKTFSGETPQGDDQTMVVVRVD